ncbi:transmembrane [Fusarium albosuccineum]|uniref:Transmembrane n=1 Tax=Fusarium albosuccineum TaxID=1237068 RepID=A0A8H4LAX4_9HYPO|nr:transmembrane [Fusarium albosuccineum]
MARPLNDYDNIAIAEIVVYSIFLVGALILCKTHGFGRNAGWLYLLILSLARLIGSSMILASINDPSNTSLYIGWLTLNGIGLGPLILTLLGLLSRCFDSINRQGHVVVKPIYQRLIQLLMLVAIILIAVGGSNSSYTINSGTSKVDYSTESKVGAILMIVVLVLLVLQTLFALRNQGYISQGEHRLLIAICASLPFVVVRLAYSCLLILGGHKQTVWLYLGASVIMEIMVALICEAVGFTLNKKPAPTSQEEVPMKTRGPAGSA